MFQQFKGMVDAIRIVIADDYPCFRLGVRAFLEKQPRLEIVGETDVSEDILTLCTRVSPRILLLSLRLPGLTDKDLSIIRERFPEMKVIMFGSREDRERLAHYLINGVNGCFLKDADPEFILTAIRCVLNCEYWFQREMTETVLNSLRHSKSDHTDSPSNLSKRETEVITFLAQGLRNQEIADHLYISESTVKVHVANIFNKIGVRDRVEAVRYAIRLGMVTV